MAMSSNHDLVTRGGNKITLRALCGTLPSHFLDNIPITQETIRKPRNQLAESQDNLIKSLRAQEENSNSKIAALEKMVRELRNELAQSQRAGNEREDSLNEMIRSLRADFRTQETSSDQTIATLHQEKDSLNETINSLRADLRTRDETSSASTVSLAHAWLTVFLSLTSVRPKNNDSQQGYPRAPEPTCHMPARSQSGKGYSQRNHQLSSCRSSHT
ncbi:hypothetical protein HD554DRAFT_2074187 [Boletus coccyginus]|nr:hypothetical protein HD554DRAFT_2074187 [Boletus coccyginus]